MAKITQVTLVDDLDGGAADETVLFGLDGDAYEIDLSEANAQALRDLLAPYLDKARKAETRTPARKSTATRSAGAGAGSGTPTSVIRAWAIETGHPVNTRGRIPAEVVAAYEAAHS